MCPCEQVWQFLVANEIRGQGVDGNKEDGDDRLIHRLEDLATPIFPTPDVGIRPDRDRVVGCAKLLLQQFQMPHKLVFPRHIFMAVTDKEVGH